MQIYRELLAAFLDLATFCDQYYTCFVKFSSVEADVRGRAVMLRIISDVDLKN